VEPTDAAIGGDQSVIAAQLAGLGHRSSKERQHRFPVVSVEVLLPEVGFQKPIDRIAEDRRSLLAHEGEPQRRICGPRDHVIDSFDELAIASVAGDAQFGDAKLVFASVGFA
jgi:hypothetical protein